MIPLVKQHKKAGVHIFVIFVIVFFFLVVPTFSPDDVLTTGSIIYFLGWETFLILCVIAFALLAFVLFNGTTRKVAKSDMKKIKIFTEKQTRKVF